jgi:hypothetical protein
MRVADLMKEMDKVEQGLTCPIELATRIKSLQTVLDDCQKQLKEYLFDELEGREAIEMNGYKVEKRNGRKMWKFDHIPAYAQVKSEMKDRLKGIEDTAKLAYDNQIKGRAELVDADTGEIIEPAHLTYTADTIAFIKVKA